VVARRLPHSRDQGGQRVIGAFELADALGMPRPTDEQRAVIEAPLVPSLVIAGAGSGKTATMANRVVWLLANGHVRVNEVLGLTFTRKAAGELGTRISGHIDSLRSAGLLPSALPAGAMVDGAADSSDLFDRPMVSTYNSFGNTIFRDNALLVGREPESVLLGENAAWGLARRTVLSEGDERLVPLRKNLDQLVDAVLSLSGELS
jgi:DNA helicase-2/ATP-dependent DNA helicase PcrA